MRLLYILLIAMLADVGFAQAPDQPKNRTSQQLKIQADKMYESKMYFSAIPFYQKILAKQMDKESAWKLADCYWTLGYYDSAIVYMNKSNVNTFQSNERFAAYYQRKGDTKNALAYLEQSLKNSSVQEQRYANQKKEAILNVSTFFKDSLDWTLSYLSFNTSAREFAPSLHNGQLYFISNRDAGFIVPRTNITDGLPYDGVYNAGGLSYLTMVNPVLVTKQPLVFSTRNLTDLTASTSNDNNVLQPSSRMQVSAPSSGMLPKVLKNAVFKGHVGPISLANNGNEVYFTRTSRRKINGAYQLEICRAVKKGSDWSTPSILIINDSLSSSFHPYYDEQNRTLYFSSDRLGGQGGSDIYKSSLESDGAWSKPLNLGTNINTIKDEGFPTVSNGKLYFASNGWAGLGGVDIFTTDVVSLSSVPKNLGYPINSTLDDYAIVFSNENAAGYFTSNRYGSDDILAFSYAPKYVTVKGAVTNQGTGLRQSGVKVFLEQKELSGNWKVLDSYVTDHKGVYAFKVRPNQSNYRFRLTGDNITTSEQLQYFDTEGVTASKELDAINLTVQANESERAETVTSNVSIDINSSATQRTTVRIYHYFNNTGYVQESHKDLQKLIKLINSNRELKIKISSAADCFGNAQLNLELSKRRAEYIQSLFPQDVQSRIQIEWVGNTKPAKQCNTKSRTFASEQINRYTEIKML